MVKLRWKFGIVAGLILAVFSCYPQIKMLYLRGSDWQGAYAFNDIDEVAYAAYLGALIDGRPRRNDPYTARDDSPEHQQEESLFSIQFAAPYLVAIPAKILGLTVNSAIWISGGLAAFIAGLALFWLIGEITGDSIYAMTGALIVICGGALFAGEGAIEEVFQNGTMSYPYFPGLRRYVPAVPFAAFFIFCGMVWQLITNNLRPHRFLFLTISVVCFAFTVFSYFYIWTTAVALLVCLTALWLFARPENFRRDFSWLLALDALCGLCLIPYAYLLSHRSHTMDDVQLLVFTHKPDFTRIPALIGLTVVMMLALAILLKVVKLRDTATIFVASLAFSVLAVFNQQIITGRSLQPIHYQVFIGNYVAGLALVLTLGLLFKTIATTRLKTFAFTLMAIIAAFWGLVECHYTVRVLDDANIARDEWMPVAKRLAELSVNDVASLGSDRAITFATSLLQADDLPANAPQGVLWSRHQHVFAGVTWQENKERYYQYLYYLGLNQDWLANSMKEGDFVSSIALFGWGRHSDRLNSEAKPLTFAEIDEEAARFGEYCRNFNAKNPGVPRISYLVVPNDAVPDLDNFDRWYIRETGEKIGNYTIYKVNLREK